MSSTIRQSNSCASAAAYSNPVGSYGFRCRRSIDRTGCCQPSDTPPTQEGDARCQRFQRCGVRPNGDSQPKPSCENFLIALNRTKMNWTRSQVARFSKTESAWG